MAEVILLPTSRLLWWDWPRIKMENKDGGQWLRKAASEANKKKSDFRKKLILGWLAVIGVFSGVLFYAVQTNNRTVVMVLVAVYIAFGLYVTGRINRNK